MDYVGWVLIGIIVITLAWISFGSRKKRWYKVYLANNDVMLLQRDLKERWWRTSDRYLRFVDEFGREHTFPTNGHGWILYWVEVPNKELSIVKEEIKRIKEERAKDNG
jgi:hypothetical protein